MIYKTPLSGLKKALFGQPTDQGCHRRKFNQVEKVWYTNDLTTTRPLYNRPNKPGAKPDQLESPYAFEK